MVVVTRIAPSPSGKIHFGNIRTALWNYLFAKANKGKFLLRIDDTDADRSDDQNIESIKQSLRFLDIKIDSEFSQSDNLEKYNKVLELLLKKGFAYKCYLTNEELKAMKEHNMNNKVKIRSKWRDYKGDEVDGNYVIRFKVELEKDYIVKDIVYGDVVFKAEEIDDFIIARQDGSILYMLASVIDDINYKVTHIIRGEDHLTNSPKAIAIYQALGKKLPVFAHVPLLQDAAGVKMSKRKDNASFTDYINDYLPEAIINYLFILGNHAEPEITQDYKSFDLYKLGKASVRFDKDKLKSFNKHYIKIHKNLTEYIDILKYDTTIDEVDKIDKIIEYVKDRCSLLSDFDKYIPMYLYNTQIDKYEVLKKDLRFELDELYSILIKNIHNEKEMFNFIKEFAKLKNIKLKDIMDDLRIVITGHKETPSIVEIIVFIGEAGLKKRFQMFKDYDE